MRQLHPTVVTEDGARLAFCGPRCAQRWAQSAARRRTGCGGGLHVGDVEKPPGSCGHCAGCGDRLGVDAGCGLCGGSGCAEVSWWASLDGALFAGFATLLRSGLYDPAREPGSLELLASTEVRAAAAMDLAVTDALAEMVVTGVDRDALAAAAALFG